MNSVDSFFSSISKKKKIVKKSLEDSERKKTIPIPFRFISKDEKGTTVFDKIKRGLSKIENIKNSSLFLKLYQKISSEFLFQIDDFILFLYFYKKEDFFEIYNSLIKYFSTNEFSENETERTFETKYQKWFYRLKSEAEKNLKFYEIFKNLRNQLNKIKPDLTAVQISKFKIRGKIGYLPRQEKTLEDSEDLENSNSFLTLKPTDGRFLLNEVDTNELTRFCVFVPNEGEKIYKFSSSFLNEKDKDSIPKEIPKNTLYIQTHGKPEERFHILISFSSSSFEILNDFTTNESWEDFKKKFVKIFDGDISLTNIEKYDISGSFSALSYQKENETYPIDFDFPSFLDLVFLSENFSNLISFNESKNPYGKRKNPFFRFSLQRDVPGEDLRFSIQKNVLFERKDFFLVSPKDITQDSKDEILEKDPGDIFVQINVLGAENMEKLEIFFVLFSLLFSIYNLPENIKEIRSEYKFFLGNKNFKRAMEQEIVRKKETKTKKILSKEASRIERLQSLYPSVFKIPGYTRKCSASENRQPLIVPDDEVEKIKKGFFLVGNSKFPIQVVKFPPDNPQFDQSLSFNFACAVPGEKNPRAPHPGLVAINSDSYAAAPCCFKASQTSKKSSKFTLYYSSQTSEKRGAGGQGNIIKKDKRLGPGNFGLLKPEIEQILTHGRYENSSFYRYGIPYEKDDPNALLHCCLTALKIPEYLSLKHPEKIEYAKQFRERFFEFVNPEVVKQEIYEYDTNDIQEIFLDPTYQLDSKWAFRVLEEIFNINIFVFHFWTPATKEKKWETFLEIPRSRSFHIRNPRPARESLFLVRHRGGEFDGHKEDHYEIIVQTESKLESEKSLKKKKIDESEIQFIFPGFLSYLVEKIFLRTNLIYSFEIEDKKIVTRQPFGLFDPISFFSNFEILGQILDDFGKLRGLHLSFENEKYQVLFPPAQPLDLPQVEVLRDPNEFGSVETLMKIFPTPNSVAYEDEEILGLWYSFADFPEYFFFSCNGRTQLYDLKISHVPFLLQEQKEDLKKIEEKIQKARLLRQIFLLLYSLYPNSFSLDSRRREKNVRNFLSKYSILRKKENEDFYDLSSIPEKIPEDLNEALKVLEKEIPTLVSNEKIIFYTEDFRERIRFLLLKENQIPINFELRIPFQTPNDFRKSLDSQIIFGENKFEEWFKTSFRKEINFQKSLDSSDFLRNEPFLFLYSFEEGKRIFLIQNIKNGNLSKARILAEIWEEKRQNLGPNFDEKKFKNPSLPYLLYGVDPSGNLIPQKDKTEGENNFVEILEFEGKFSALLSIHSE